MSDGLNSVKKILKDWYVIVVLLSIWIIFGIVEPGYFSVGNIERIVVYSIPLLAVSLAQNAVILTGGFDLTVGAQVSLMTAILSVLMTYSVFGSLAVAILVGGAIGFVNGIGVTKFDINPFLMTLGMMFVIEGVTLIIRPTPGGYVSGAFSDYLRYTYNGVPIGPFLIFFGVGVFGAWFFEKRHLGRLIYAVGSSEEKSFLRGIDVGNIKLKAFIFSGFMAAFGGIYMAAQAKTGDPTIGGPLLFSSITAVLLGGTRVSGGVGRFPNTVAAVLILGSATSFLFYLGYSEWYRYLINGSLLVIVAIVQRYTDLGA
ncbi:MAG: ABC transporter permease [Candidatus Hadarchaeota archaeon]